MFGYRNILRVIINKCKLIFENSLYSLLMLANIGPTLGGYGLFVKRSGLILGVLWLCQFALLFYVYSVSSITYIVFYTPSFLDTIQSFFNILGNVIIFNSGFWYMNNRYRLQNLLILIKENNKLVLNNSLHVDKLEKSLSVIKKSIIFFYILIFLDSLIHFPEHAKIETLTNPDTFSMIKCFGLQPVSQSPNYEFCLSVIVVQGWTMVCMVLAYKTMLILLITHTTTMYSMLSLDVEGLTKYEQSYSDQLSVIIYRHSLILKTVKKLQSIYSVPIGVDFGGNAFCICLSFIIPLNKVPKFMTTIIYCLSDFFLYCFLCQLLENASEKFEKAIYSCGWENFHRNDQKSILIMLIQAQKPISIKAAGIIPVRMYTFANTMQSIYKFGAAFKI